LVPEVRQSLSTLYRKAQAHAAGEKVEFNGKKFSPLYTPKNQTLIDYLNITPDEERQLGTIISETEAADRHRKRDEVKRREAGAVDRASYLETAEMKRAHALLLRAKGMKQREIAAEMGVSVMAVNGYLKSKG
jgi:DNA-directed RNA polymerase specialized sigma24 family protein